MSNKHTPGPWAMPDSGQGRISKVGANGGWDGLIATADCGDFARSRSEGLANALLIAAAPELLEALQRFVKVMDESYDYPDTSGELQRLREAANEARAAIAKATGGAA